ncbi:AAA family ATPase [Chloroflexota bacterium]
MAKGRTIDEIRADAEAMEHGLIEMQLKFERALRTMDVAFLDRGLPDGLTYSRVAGLNPNDILSECFHHRYASVFILNRLPIQQDDQRIEGDAIADFLDEWLARDYSTLGYSVFRVPLLSLEERLTFILESLIIED